MNGVTLVVLHKLDSLPPNWLLIKTASHPVSALTCCQKEFSTFLLFMAARIIYLSGVVLHSGGDDAGRYEDKQLHSKEHNRTGCCRHCITLHFFILKQKQCNHCTGSFIYLSCIYFIVVFKKKDFLLLQLVSGLRIADTEMADTGVPRKNHLPFHFLTSAVHIYMFYTKNGGQVPFILFFFNLFFKYCLTLYLAPTC